MKNFKIIIEIEDFEGIYSCENINHAKVIAEEKSNEIYYRLNCKNTITVKSVEEVKK